MGGEIGTGKFAEEESLFLGIIRGYSGIYFEKNVEIYSQNYYCYFFLGIFLFLNHGNFVKKI